MLLKESPEYVRLSLASAMTFISLLLVFMIFPVYAYTTKGVLSEEARMCLSCHSNKEMTKQLESKEILSLYINGDKFADSVHNVIGCTGCHIGISAAKIADHFQIKKIKSKKEYTANASKACLMCHTDDQLKKIPIHASLMVAATCVECHGSHAIKRIKIQKAVITESRYCLICHRSRLSMTMKNGEKLSIFVDEALLKNSAHNKHSCSDCHSEFSKKHHPVRTFESLHAYSSAISNVCRKCHLKEFTSLEGSIHFIMLKKKVPKAPVCTECHTAHSVAPKERYKTLAGVPCKKCHEDVFNAYKEGVHGKAKLKGIEKAPICSSCHKAHEVKVTSMTELMKDECLRCHKGVENAHKKWLSNPPIALSSFPMLHFDVISCATCHSPVAVRGIYLCLYDRITGKPFTDEQIKRLLGTDPDEFMRRMAHGDEIDASELWAIVKYLRKKAQAEVIFQGRMDVQKGIDAHKIALKSEAVRECDKCHRADSDFFKNVKVVIIKAEGRPGFYSAKQKVLGSVFSVASLSQFYALGSTRLKLLDILFIIAVIGGIAVPIGHITLRVITSPLRSLRKMEKGVKK